MIEKLTWRNLWRNRRRTLITMGSITFAVLFAILMQSFQKGIFDNLVKNVVGFYHGNLQIHQQGYWEEQVIDNNFAMEVSMTDKITQNSNIKGIVPRIETFILVSKDSITKGCLVVGTDMAKEDQLTHLKSRVTKGQYIVNGESAALVSEGLAQRLHLTVNDTIVLLGQGYQGAMAAGKYLVKGIVHFGSPALNNGMVYLPLADAQSLLNAENRFTSMALDIGSSENLAVIQSEIKAITGPEYEVMTWNEMMPEIGNMIKGKAASFYIFTGILYLIIGFGIFGTILMMTAERRYEFGMLVAIGMKKSWLGRMLLGETILITLLGVLSGIGISLPIVLYMKNQPIKASGKMAEAYEQFGFEAVLPTAFDPQIFLQQSLTVLVIAFIIGLYPLWHIHRLDPVAAMKGPA